jgi:hypothetical protein
MAFYAGLATLHSVELSHVLKDSSKFNCVTQTQQYFIYLIRY